MGLSEKIQDIKRFEEILSVLFKNELGYYIHHLRLKDHLSLHQRLRKDKFQKKDTQPIRLRKAFEELGGTFVKLGQLLSLRPDLIPKEYCDEFRRLQDNVPPFKDAKKYVEKELGKDLKDIFFDFDEKPLAAASFGQVHKATLKNKEKVIVKIQRPDIKEKVQTDIDIMYYFADIIDKKLKPDLFDPIEIVKEFESYTKSELNYTKESKNLEIVSKNFTDYKGIVIPKVYKEFTTPKLLVMQYIDGTKLDQVNKKNLDTKVILRKILNAEFKQIFIDGFFHADPHPGNLLVIKKNDVAFIDFGIIGYLGGSLKNALTKLFISLVEGDIEKMADSFYDLSFVDETVDMPGFKKDLYDNFMEYYNVGLEKVSISDVFHKIITISKKYNIKLHTDFILLGKTTATLEGLAISVDPKFNIVEESKPFVHNLIKDKISTKNIIHRLKESTFKLKDFISEFPDKTNLLLRRMKEADTDIKSIGKDIQSLVLEMDKASNRVTLGLISTAIIISSTMLMPYNQIKFFGVPYLSFIGFMIALFLIIIIIRSILNEKKF